LRLSFYTCSKQPYRAPDSQSFFVDGKPLDYLARLFSEEHMKSIGIFDTNATSMLLKKCAQGRAMGFADNMAFVGILSTMLVDAIFISNSSHDFMELS
jgi:asparagine synthase (glutamine-hydrolysing)